MLFCLVTKPSRWKGLADLVCDAVDGTTRLAEATQNSVASVIVGHLSKIEAINKPANLVNEVRRFGLGLTAGAVCGVNQSVRAVVRTAADYGTSAQDPSTPGLKQGLAVPMRSDMQQSPLFVADALLGVVNGVVGDHVRARDNDLDLGMCLRFEDQYFGPKEVSEVLKTEATPKVALFIHGLAATETSWVMGAERAWGTPNLHFGIKLREDLGYTPLFVRYNSGLHVSENGRVLAALIEQLYKCYPGQLVDLALIGHSLGGLVARSATHYASRDKGGRPGWLDVLKHVVTIGTPHFGSPLAQAGHALTSAMGAIETPATQIVATIGRLRSAAIKDLKAGYLVDEDWQGKDPDAWLSAPRSDIGFLAGVAYVFVGASVTSDPYNAVGRLVGDVLVRLSSSTHSCVDRQCTSFAIERPVLGGLHHLQIQNDPQVYEQIRLQLAGESGAT